MVQASLKAEEFENFIGGEWRPADSGTLFETYDPATGELVARCASSDERDVSSAVTMAQLAFSKSRWAKDPLLRYRVLMEMAAVLEANISDLATLDTRETGKPIGDAFGEIRASVDSLRYASALARTVVGRSRLNRPDSISMTIREPVGVIAQIIPWNAPIILLVRDLAPALAAGNVIVVKPPSLASGVVAQMFKLFSSISELPEGVLSLVMGSANTVGVPLAEHRQVKMIILTGSADTGKSVYQIAAKQLKRVHLELGGKSPFVVFEDADIERAIPSLLRNAYVFAGQFCMCASRLIVERSIHDSLVDALKSRVEQLVVGNGIDPKTQMGPMISGSQMESVLEACERGAKDADLVTGGFQLRGDSRDLGHFIAPTIFDNVKPDSELAQEELFGPVLSVQTFTNEEEALELANNTNYGLVGAVWTNRLDRAMRMSQGIQAGTVWVNTYYETFPEIESGGTKDSGVGRTRGTDGLNEFTELKHVNFVYNSQP